MHRKRCKSILPCCCSIPFILTLSLLLPIFEAASPFRQRSICGPALCFEGTKFHYKEGNVYIYQYNINGTTSISRGPTEQSGLHVSSQVALKFISPCEAVLFMKDVELWQSHAPSSAGGGESQHKFSRQDSQQHFKNGLEEYPLRFSYADGIIEEVCPDSRESAWVLNVKRGLLSSLQNTMRRLDLEHKGEEDDIHGHCKAEYKLGTATSSSLTIDRIKDISSCGDKFGIFSSVQGTPYSFGAKHQSMPAVASTSECHQMVDRNLIAATRCSETHRLGTLARGVAGVVSNIEQSLQLLSIVDPNFRTKEATTVSSLTIEPDDEDEDEEKMPSTSPSSHDEDGTETNLPSTSATLPPLFSDLVISYYPQNVLRRESLHFKHDFHLGGPTPYSASSANDLNAGKQALEKFCLSVKDEVKSESGLHFDTLVDILRRFSLEDMTTLSKEAAAICLGDRTHFDNALEAVGSSASVGVIKEKILQRNASRSTIQSWISSLTYIPKPDLQLMETAVDILKERDTYPQIILTFSSLAHSYCRHHPHCTRHRPITLLIKLYEKVFNYTSCVAKKPKEVDQLVMYLKGIGNFGQFSEGIESALRTCILQSDREEIKVTAMEAYRRMSCNSDQSMLSRVFQNESEDSEVRIAAFIGLMRCPTYSTIRSIKETLKREQVNQVGSFVWTYLKNLQKTALPSKAELQGLVADENLSKKFAIDVRKFSRNFEISTFHDDLNFGIGLESNMIFSQKSYLPRSIMLNLTVDLFGESINVFEAGLRLENFEHHIESMFGPKGKFRNREFHGVLSSLREKRAVPSKRKLKTLSTEYDAHKRYYSDPVASFSLKTFGNEILFERRTGADETDILGSLNPFQYIKQFGDKNINWQKSTLLLESSYIIPTGVGIPLNLSAQASSILRLNTMSLMEVENLRVSSELKLKGKFEPSALLTVKGGMTFGTGRFQTGIEVRAHIHTSTAFEGSFHVKGTKLLKIDVGLPKTKQEILEYRSDVLFMQNNEFIPVGQLPKRNPVCTNGFLEKTLGIKFCKSLYFSLSPGSERDNLLSPYFPLNGPAQFAITVEKTNPTFTSTRLNYKWDDDEKATKLSAMYELEGPETIKLLGFTYLMNKLNQDFHFGVNIPGNSLQASGYSDGRLSGGVNITALSNNLSALNALVTYTKKPRKATTTTDNDKMNMDLEMLVTLYDKKILDAKVKVTPTEPVNFKENYGVSFDGDGQLHLSNPLKLNFRGQLNGTRFAYNLNGEYKARTGSIPETIKFKSTINKHAETQQIDTSLNLESSEFPDYNLDASWMFQSNDEGVDSETNLRLGRGPVWSDSGALRIQHRLVHQTRYDGSSREVSLWITQPSRQMDCGFEAKVDRVGKDVDSSINLRFSPEKKFQTSLSLKRAPGVLTFLQIGWNTTISNQPPLQISFHLEETSSRIYQGKFQTDWFGSNNINIGLNFMDRATKRQHFNKELKLSIETSTLDRVVLSSQIFHKAEKESKLLLNAEYQNQIMGWEIARKQHKGDKQSLVFSFKNGPKAYVITSDLDTANNGFHLLLKTDLQLKFPDVELEMRVQHEIGMRSLGLIYKWNARVDETRKLALDFFIDLTKQHQTELKLNYPGQSLVVSGQRHGSDGNQLVTGRLNWNDDIRLHANASFISSRNHQQPYPYETKFLILSQRNNFNDAIYSLRLTCDNQIDCLVKGDMNWGDNQHVNMILGYEFRHLPSEEVGQDEDDEEEEKDYGPNKDYFIDNDDDDDDDNDGDERKNQVRISRKTLGSNNGDRKTKPFSTFRPFSLSLQGNLTASMDDWKEVQISMLHTHQSPLHLKTDIDIQLPNGNDINFASHWYIPVTWKQIWSTRAELHVKTPFETLQNFHLQTVIGHQEDSDTLATAGIYMDNIQYSMTIAGTPRFGEDGSLRIEISTSNPNYDKIFCTLSYAIGLRSRLAYQLGWPNFIMGLETGFEWSGSWEEFQVYFNFTSPWKPLKNINTLAKIDTSQMEVKMEVNDHGVEIKCNWAIESLSTLDIRFEGTAAFVDTQKAGFLLKNSFEDEATYSSQVSFYANEYQIGYKLEGGRSEVEEGSIVAKRINSEIEIDTIVYPRIRSTFNLVQKETKFELGVSLLLREGPINISGDLHLLDLFSFNEKIKITTPYPGLFELEFNLSPAILPESDVYNFGSHARWRSRSEWQEGGLFVRYGDQSAYRDILQGYLENEDFDDDDDDEDDYSDEQTKRIESKPKTVISVPQSQLFHFHSPLTWAKVFKIEYEKIKTITDNTENQAKEDEDDDDDNEDSGIDEEPDKMIAKKAVFPIRTFSFVYNTDTSQLTTELKNEPTLKLVSGHIDIREIQQPISLKFDITYDTTTADNKFNINAASYQPKLDQFIVTTSWQTRANYLNGFAELRTPFENWEVQSVSAMYAQNIVEKIQTHDWELKSETFGKMGTNVVYGPGHFSVMLNTPFEDFKDVELSALSNVIEGFPEKFNTVVTVKNHEKEIVQIDVDSLMENGLPTQMSGTITTTLRNYREGNLTANVKNRVNQLNANGQMDWEAQKLKISLLVKLPKTKFEELDLRVETPFKNYERWKLWIQKVEGESENEELGEDETDDEEDNEDDDDENESENKVKDTFNFVFKADTPISSFSTVTGFGRFPLVVHGVKKVSLSGNAPNGSIDIMTSWIISDWNSFDIHCDSKYSHSIELALLPSALRSLPTHNFLKFKLRNVIPTLESISHLDFVFYSEIEQPAFRLGGSGFLEIQKGQSLNLKLSAKLLNNSHSIDVKSQHDQNLNSLNADIAYTHGSPSTAWTSNIQMNRDEKSVQGDAEIDFGNSNPLQSKFNYTFNREVSELHLQMFAKKNPNIPIATLDATFDLNSRRHKTRLYAIDEDRASEPILIELDVGYKNLFNFDSSLNASTPYAEIPSFGLRGTTTAMGNNYEGVFGGHWAENKTSITYNFAIENLRDLKKFNGSVAVELPFESYQRGSLGGSFNNKVIEFESTLRAELNSIVYIDSLYTTESSSRAGIEKELRKLEVGNPFWPIGLAKLYQYEYSGGYNGLNLPTTTVRLVEVYDLVQRDLHKLGGELKIQTNFNGREITLSGIHPSRRVVLSSNYEFLDHQFAQNTNLSWSPESWIGYQFNIKNKTTFEQTEHIVDLRVSYPVRVIAINSACLSDGKTLKLTTNLNMNASQSEKRLTGIFRWDVEQDESQEITQKMSIILTHPSLVQDIRAEGKFKVTDEKLLVGELSLDYSGDSSRTALVKMHSKLPFGERYYDNSYYWNATTDLILQHSATNLDLKAFSSTQHSPHELSIITLIDFKNREKLPRKSKISFELFKQLRELHIMLSNPEEYITFRGEMTGQHPLYFANVEANSTGIHPHMKGQMAVDSSKPYFRMYAVHGEDLTDGIYCEGGIIDSRNVKFHIYESYDNFKFSDVNFFLRMNHSRLVTSKLKWRPELLEELQTVYKKQMQRLKLIWNQQSDKLVHTVSADASQVIQQIWEDAITTIGPFLQDMSEDLSFGKDSEALHQFFRDAKENNDFYSQDIGSIAQVFAEEVSVRYANVYIKIREYRQEILGDTTTTEMFENSLLWILEKMKDTYRTLSTKWKKIKLDTSAWTPGSTDFTNDIKLKLADIIHQALDSTINMSVRISDSIGETISNTGHSIASYSVQTFEQHKPYIFGLVDRVEVILYNVLVEVSDYMYETQNTVLKSNIYQKFAGLGRDIDQLYYDLSKNSARTNIRKYYSILRSFIRRKFVDIDEYQQQLGEVGNQVSDLWHRLQSFAPIQSLKNTLHHIGAQVSWLIHYFKFEQLFQELIITLYHRGYDLLYQTALQANARYQQFKTRFIFDADKGDIEWEQKLPMPWSAFNETPVFTELPEYKNIMKLQNLFQSSSESFWDAYKAQVTRTDSLDWMPPFDGQAMMAGSDKFFTFDGKFYTFTGSCSYLLTADLVDGNFSIAIQYKKLSDNSMGHQTIVTAGHNTLIYDFEENSLKDPKKNHTLPLPVQMQYLQGYRDNSNLVVEHTNGGFTFSCNMQYQICQLKVSGWYSRKVGGLLGTMDEEPTTDLMLSNGKITSNINAMAQSWNVSDENTTCLDRASDTRSPTFGQRPDAKVASSCNKIFAKRFSSLQPCFNIVNVEPYVDMCLNGSSNLLAKVCASAMAYVLTCQRNGIYVQIPSSCVRCDVNGEEMMDRDIKVMDSSSTSNFVSTDIVLIVEAKDCNRNIRGRKRMSNLINSLEIELIRQGFRNNRYAIVAFGGSGVFKQAHSIAYNGQLFTNAAQLEKFINSFPTSSGNGSGDVFGAINYSLNLAFRAGVSKTLILMPCSSCQPQHMTLDFPTIRHAMLEQAATLHILMNNDFPLDNKKLAKKFFAMDNDVVYTKLDATKNVLRGNAALRKQVKVSKTNLGYCSPLALETNGTIFNGKKLNNKKEPVVKWFSSIFTRRVVQTAQTPSCRTCYCTADENGLGKLQCLLCDNPRFKYIENEVETDSDENLAKQELVGPIPVVEPDEDSDNKNDDDDEDY